MEKIVKSRKKPKIGTPQDELSQDQASDKTPVALITQLAQLAPAEDKRTMPRLSQAVQAKDADLVEALLKEGDNIDAEGYAGWTAAHVAAFEGQYDILKLLIKNKAATIVDDRKWTPFYFAVAKGDIAIARLLCEHEANINHPGLVIMQDGKEISLTPLEYAIFNKNLQMTAFLIKHGARFSTNKTKNLMLVAIQAFNESDSIEARLKSLDIICLLIEVGVFTGTNSKADLLNQIQDPDAQRYAKEKREMYQLESWLLFKNRTPKAIRNNCIPFSIPIRRFLRTRFILQGWHPHLLSLSRLFQTKLSQLPSSNHSFDKFLQAVVQFQLISYLTYELPYYNPKESCSSTIPAAFQKQPDINSLALYEGAIDLLYQEYLPPSRRLDSHKKAEVILGCLRRCTLEQINEHYILKLKHILQYYMMKQGNSGHPYLRDIEIVYRGTNPELQNELIRGFLGNCRAPSYNLAK